MLSEDSMNSSEASQCEDESINTIPNEILAEIFTNVGVDGQFAIRQVCSQWQDIMDHCIGVDLHLGTPEPAIWRGYNETPFQQAEVIRDYGVKRCFISRLETPEALSGVQERNLQWKTTVRLSDLWIDGFIHHDTFNHLTQNMQRLRSLEIHFSTLASMPITSFANLKMEGLVNLESFSIRMFTFRGHIRYKSIGIGLINGITLFNSQSFAFPKLNELYLSFPFEENFSRHLSRAICSCLRRHAPSIRKLDLGFSRVAESTRVFPGDPGEAFTPAHVAGVNLESIRVACALPDHHSMEVFKYLVDGQRYLRSLNSFFGRLSPADALRPCFSSFATLVQVQLSLKNRPNGVPTNPVAPFDLAPLRRCVNLQVLKLIGQERPHRWNQTHEPNLINVAALPNNLRILTFSNLLIPAPDVAQFFGNTPSLESVQLFNIGTSGTMGLNFETFVRILMESRIQQLSIKHSINRTSIAAAVSSTDPIIRAASVMLQLANRPLKNYFTLRWVDGHYDTEDDVPEAETGNFPDGGPRPIFLTGDDDFYINNLDHAIFDLSEDEDVDDGGVEDDLETEDEDISEDEGAVSDYQPDLSDLDTEDEDDIDLALPVAMHMSDSEGDDPGDDGDLDDDEVE